MSKLRKLLLEWLDKPRPKMEHIDHGMQIGNTKIMYQSYNTENKSTTITISTPVNQLRITAFDSGALVIDSD